MYNLKETRQMRVRLLYASALNAVQEIDGFIPMMGHTITRFEPHISIDSKTKTLGPSTPI